MNCIVYVHDTPDIPIYAQFNAVSHHCKRHGYSICGKVLDFQGNKFHDAMNMLIADQSITALMLYDKDTVFPKHEDYLFFKIYCEKLGKKLISCN